MVQWTISSDERREPKRAAARGNFHNLSWPGLAPAIHAYAPAVAAVRAAITRPSSNRMTTDATSPPASANMPAA